MGPPSPPAGPHVPIEVQPEQGPKPEPKDEGPTRVMLRLSELEVNACHREEECIHELFGSAVVTRQSNPYAFLGNLDSDEEEEDDEVV